MKKSIIKTLSFVITAIMIITLPGCSQFETPLEIPESGSIQVITTADSRCALYKSNNLLMEWTGSKVIPGMLAGNYRVIIISDKFNSSFEESFQLGARQQKNFEIGTGGLEIKVKSDFTWELTKDNKLILSGEGSLRIDTLWTGAYKLKVVVPGVANNFIRDISITKAQTYNLEMEYGSLDVRIPSSMEATLLHGTTELARWNGSKVIDSLWVGDYSVKIKVNPLLPDYKTNITLLKQQAKVVEPLFGSFTIKTKSDFQNSLFVEGVEQFSWTGSKEFNPWIAGNYTLKSKMFPVSSAVEQSFIVQQNENKIIEWEYGKITINTLPVSNCKLKRVGIEILSWRGGKVLDSIITGNYTLEIQEDANQPLWSETFTLNRDEQKNIAIPYASIELISSVATSLTKLIYNGSTLETLSGSGTISAVVPGSYILTVEATGYISQTENITLSNSQILQKNIQLVQIPPFTPMVYIPAGTFTMGCTNEQSGCNSDETPTHQVTLSAYEIGKFEVTQKEWQTIMGTSPSYFKGENRPVEQVYWNDIITFCNTLSSSEGLTPVYTVNGSTVTANWSANGYRLPTEAEWEYAARGGASSTNTLYSGSNTLEDVGWYNSNSGNTTHDVGTKSPNQLGIYDMSGNVFEWVWDYYGSYSSGSQTNPTGPTTGSLRVLRGGGWGLGAEYCRLVNRDNNGSVNHGGDDYGFRLARTK